MESIRALAIHRTKKREWIMSGESFEKLNAEKEAARYAAYTKEREEKARLAQAKERQQNAGYCCKSFYAGSAETLSQKPKLTGYPFP